MQIITNASEDPQIVFNEMPGDKFMSIEMALVDEHGNVVDRDVDLEATLCFHDRDVIDEVKPIEKKPELLIFKEAPRLIGGRGVLRVRIMQISRNHQGRLFSLRIAPQFPDNDFDIMATKCGAYEVRTKIADSKDDSSEGSAGRPVKRRRSSMTPKIKTEATAKNEISPAARSVSSLGHGSLFSQTALPSSIVDRLDAHVNRVRAITWQKVPVMAMNANGNAIETSSAIYQPTANPNAFIEAFIREYDTSFLSFLICLI